MQSIILLGATGSVGSSVLDVIRHYPEHFQLLAFSAWNNIDKAIQIITEFKPKYVALRQKHDNLILLFPDIHFIYGKEALNELVQIDQSAKVVSAVLGLAGLIPAIKALESGKDLIIANKEALVSGGYFLEKAQQKGKSQIIPLDSEHLALFDLLRGKEPNEIQSLILTASGGPFFNKEISTQTTIQEVLKHPTWSMGSAITVGSALMLNKGLEIIEAMRLFHMPEHKIKVLVHPQSIVHGAVHTKGGHWHLLASPPDMRYPALHSLFYPQTPFEAPFGEYDPTQKALEFFEPDLQKFPLLSLARHVAREDGLLPTVLCAVMEVCIEQFLNGSVAFYRLPDLIEEFVLKTPNNKNPEIEEILIAEKKAKIQCLERITYHGQDLT